MDGGLPHLLGVKTIKKYRAGYKRRATYTETLETVIEADSLAEAMEKFEDGDFVKWLITERFTDDIENLEGPHFIEVKDFEVDYDTH